MAGTEVPQRRHRGNRRHDMALAGKLFQGIDLARAVRGRSVAQEFFRDGLVFDGFTVEDEAVVAQFNRVAGQRPPLA